VPASSTGVGSIILETSDYHAQTKTKTRTAA